jgi:hypothetical protein
VADEERKKREPPVSYRPPADLRAEFERRVALSGLSACAFITRQIFNHEPPRRSRRPTVNHEAVAQLLGRLAEVRDGLNAVAKGSSASRPDTIVLEESLRQLIEIRAACFQALGRQP